MTAAEPTIVATCGGLIPGSWTDAVYGPLIHHAIALARVSGRRPRVTHVNTAGGDQRQVEGAELEAARLAGVDASHLRLFPHPNVSDVRAHILAQDVVWVSGGSLVNLLAVWRAHGLDAVFREAWKAGVVLAGGSAGALCWHSGGTTASFGPQIDAVPDGLGLLPASLGVHYDSDPNRRIAHRAAVADGTLPEGYALDEGVGLVYAGARVVDVIAERPGQYAWRIERSTRAGDGSGPGVHESRVEPRVLVEDPTAASPISAATATPTIPATATTTATPTTPATPTTTATPTIPATATTDNPHSEEA